MVALLLKCESIQVALKEVATWKKGQTPAWSLAWLARRMKLRSRGHISSVLSGKKNPSISFVNSFSIALALDVDEALYLKLLWQSEYENNAQLTKSAHSQLLILRRRMRIRACLIPASFVEGYFTAEVFCVFGLFPGGCSKEEIITCFSEEKQVAVARSIDRLIEFGLVVEDTERLSLIDDFVIFDGGKTTDHHIDFLRSALNDALESIALWFAKPDESFFSSTILSVDSGTYRKNLPSLKKTIRDFESKVETESGDQLVRVNIQVYPACKIEKQK